MHSDQLEEREAYDVARTEFYGERLQEDVERRIAREEALATGAHFGKSRLDIGMELENKAFDNWKIWADEQVTAAEQARAAGSTTTDAGAVGFGDTPAENDLQAISEEAGGDGAREAAVNAPFAP